MSDIAKHSDDEFYRDAERRRKTVRSRVAEACVYIDLYCDGKATAYHLWRERVAGVRTQEQADQLVAQIVKAGRGTSQFGLLGNGKKLTVVLNARYRGETPAVKEEDVIY
ncbi:MAG: hypothetical protein ACYDCS_07700 [Candidatus Dormibacteria bacterium]